MFGLLTAPEMMVKGLTKDAQAQKCRDGGSPMQWLELSVNNKRNNSQQPESRLSVSLLGTSEQQSNLLQ